MNARAGSGPWSSPWVAPATEADPLGSEDIWVTVRHAAAVIGPAEHWVTAQYRAGRLACWPESSNHDRSLLVPLAAARELANRHH